MNKLPKNKSTNNYIKKYYFEGNSRLPEDISKALSIINHEIWSIFGTEKTKAHNE